MSTVKETVDKTLNILNNLIRKEEENELIKSFEPEMEFVYKARNVGGYESPEPGDIPESQKKTLAKVYASCRADGGDKEKCAKIAWSATKRSGKSIENKVIKDMRNTVMKIYKELKQPDNTAKSDKLFEDAIKKVMSKITINRDYDIPFIAGYSKNGYVIYIDQSVPEYINIDKKPIDPIPFLVLHEAVEKAIIDQLEMDYIPAHQIAQRAEEAAIVSNSISWNEYDKAMIDIKKQIEKKSIQSVPKDLDLTPYEMEAKIYPADKNILDKMKSVMKAVDEKTVYDYQAQTDESCGAAACRIVLSQLGIEKEEKELREILKTNEKTGTEIKDIPPLFEILNLDYVVNRNSSMEDLRLFFDMKYVIIIRYFMPQYNADHYTVIKNINEELIYFFDPFYGENEMSIKNFWELWYKDKGKGNQPGWMIGIRKDHNIDMKE